MRLKSFPILFFGSHRKHNLGKPSYIWKILIKGNKPFIMNWIIKKDKKKDNTFEIIFNNFLHRTIFLIMNFIYDKNWCTSKIASHVVTKPRFKDTIKRSFGIRVNWTALLMLLQYIRTENSAGSGIDSLWF